MQIVTFRCFIVISALACSTTMALAHEFWLDPNSFEVKPGEQINAMLLVGQMMRGTEYPYLSSGFHSFTITTKNGTRDVKGMEGDIPALSYTAMIKGLHLINYNSTANEVTYNNWEEFLKYLAYEGLDDFAKIHIDRGLSDSDFKESYVRYAKTLVQVGPVNTQDQDKAKGLPFELVAKNNPYQPGLESLVVTLLRSGQAVAGRQIAIFHYDKDVSRNLVTTDKNGEAEIVIKNGGIFLLNAVDLLPVDEGRIVWTSNWASLCFGIPSVSQLIQ